MASLHSTTIDASVLAVPPTSCTKDDAVQYVKSLVDWSELSREKWIEINMREDTLAFLGRELYAENNPIGELFHAHGIFEFDVNTVAKVAGRLRTTAPSFESKYGIRYALFALANFKTQPNIFHHITDSGIRSDLAQCITLIAVLRKYCIRSPADHSIISRQAPNQEVQVRVQIDDLEHNRQELMELPMSPEFFEGSVPVCDNFLGLIEFLDEAAILVGATNDFQLRLAIRISLFKYAITQKENPDWQELNVPKINPKFRESCQKCCCDQGEFLSKGILTSIVSTVFDLKLNKTHALRSGKGGNDPQIMRNSDKAFRRDIDYEFHLHYWKCGNGTIELAKVAYHNDFSIPS